MVDPLNQTSSFTYDKVSNLLSYTDELNRTTSYTYDDLNRTLSVTDPIDRTTTNTYDPIGNLLSVTDPLDLVTTFEYDELDRTLSVTNPNLETTSYTYDRVGNQLSITDPEDNTTSYTYDNLNRTLTDTNELGHTRSYEYDVVGNVVQTSDRNGREISFEYDPLNRNTAEIWLGTDGNSIRTFDFQYDAASQLTSAVDPDSSYSYTYDDDGRITSVDNAGTPFVPNVVFDYTYDPVDNLTEVTDSIDGVDKGVETFAYDELDRVTSIAQSGNDVADKRVDMSYDAASQMKDITRYSDLEATELVADTNYTFDNASRTTDIVHQQNSETLAEFGLIYDNGDRITQFTTPSGVSEFNYDDNDQLTDASHDYQENENYSYDDNGNRTNTGYVTGDNNQLTSDGTYNYEYDNEGNRVKKTEIATGEVTEYEWDYRNRLVDVVTTDSDGNVIANSDYTYDVFDNRIGKSVDADGDGTGEAVVERYVLDGDHIALTFDGEGNQTERFLHGLGIDQVLVQENADGEVLWALTDHQNSVRVVLDNDGNIVNQIDYDSFGQITSQTDVSVDFRFSYTGREFNEETGLYYNRARYYDPNAGRFISEDPISFAAGDSNIYRYVGNNPLFYLDPSGFCGVGSSGGGDGDGNNFGEQDWWQQQQQRQQDGIEQTNDWIRDVHQRTVDRVDNTPNDFFDIDRVDNTPNDFFDAADLSLDSSDNGRSEVVERSPNLNYDFPRDESVEVAGIAIPAVKLLEALGIAASIEYQRRQEEKKLGKDKEDSKISADEAFKREEQREKREEFINDTQEFFQDLFDGTLFESRNGSFGNADPNVPIDKQLQGKGQLRDLRSNKNLRDVDINDLVRKTPRELTDMQKRGEINKKTLKQIQKAFEGRDLGKRGKKKK
ncbi:MAG: RHS repeat-associated core domain-containing protein [Cyanobacteria bacterium J06582_2]